jgi:hypothetical protein
VEHEEVTHESPAAIIAHLNKLEGDIIKGLKELEAILR